MKKKMGRPLIDIDQKAFEGLCSIQCTLEEIAAFFDCSADTIERFVKRNYGLTFAEVFKQKRKKGFVGIRRKQYELALEGDRTMLVWLGKNWLGQVDKHEIDATNNSIINVTMTKNE